jgi:hypothetical protein
MSFPTGGGGFPNSTQTQAFARRVEAGLYENRPVNILYKGDVIEAAEGRPQFAERVRATGFVRVRTCQFRILKSVLPEEPAMGATFKVEGQSLKAGKGWSIVNVLSGYGVNDVAWVIDCDEVDKA